MAFDPAPSSLFTSWAEDGTTITVPIASITDLTAAEADGTTGDWPSVIARILEHTYNYEAALADADSPTKITMTRTRSESGGVMKYRFNIAIDVDLDAISFPAS